MRRSASRQLLHQTGPPDHPMASLLAHLHHPRANDEESGVARHLLEIARLGRRGLVFVQNIGTPVRLMTPLTIGRVLTFHRLYEHSVWGLRLQ